MRRKKVGLEGVLACLAFGCAASGDTDEGDCVLAADAGEDVTVAFGSPVELAGLFESDCEGVEAPTFTWAVEFRPEGSGLDATAFGAANGTSDAAGVEIVPDATGTFVFSVTVADGALISNPDLVVVTVTPNGGVPTANAGTSGVGTIGELVHLDGSGSTDPDGDPLQYLWSLVAMADGSVLASDMVYDRHAAGAAFVPDVDGDYVASLEVYDGLTWSEPDYVAIVVASNNEGPVADAGASRTLSPCSGNPIRLSASGSYDPDGDALSVLWSLGDAPSGSGATDADFSDQTEASPTFTWDIEGEYSFALQVSDGERVSPMDVVTLTVVPLEDNQTPIAVAGEDQAISLEVDCTEAGCEECGGYSFEVDGAAGSTDPDGDSVSYEWSVVAASNAEPTLAQPTFAWTEVLFPGFETEMGVTMVTSVELRLDVADCAASSSDTVVLTLECTGVEP